MERGWKHLEVVNIQENCGARDQTLQLRRSDRTDVLNYDSAQFDGSPLRIAQRDATLPGSDTLWTFAVAQSRDEIDEQIMFSLLQCTDRTRITP